MGELADYLLLQSHSAVGLVDRAEAGGFVRRRPDPQDARIVRVELTEEGDRLVTELTRVTLTEMRKLAIALNNVLLLHEERLAEFPPGSGQTNRRRVTTPCPTSRPSHRSKWPPMPR